MWSQEWIQSPKWTNCIEIVPLGEQASRSPEPPLRQFKVYNEVMLYLAGCKSFSPMDVKSLSSVVIISTNDSVTLNASLAQHRWKPPLHSCSTSRSVSGKRVCSYCNNILGKGAAMIIETLGLCYHLQCFKVSLRQRACRPAAMLCLESAWLLWALGCGYATNKLGLLFVSLCCSWES